MYNFVEKVSNMKLNLAEILKDCPSGMEMYSPCFESVVFDRVDAKGRIRCFVGDIKDEVSFNAYGCLNGSPSAKCVLFPKGKYSWDGFKPPREFKDGDVVVVSSETEMYEAFVLKKPTTEINGFCYFGYNFDTERWYDKGLWYFDRLATEEEKQKLFDAIKAKGFKWNEETKTLEKLVKKSDISELKPLEVVLVRNDEMSLWRLGFFSHYDKGFFVTTGGCFLQCIPYAGNEHLLGTTKRL